MEGVSIRSSYQKIVERRTIGNGGRGKDFVASGQRDGIHGTVNVVELDVDGGGLEGGGDRVAGGEDEGEH